MTLQDFIEMYHPNYNCDDIAKFLDLDMYLSGEANKNAYIEGNPYTSYQEFIRIQDKIFKEAFENYYSIIRADGYNMQERAKATSREAVSEPDVLIWTSGGRIPASHLVDLDCRWVDDDIFQVKVNGVWVNAQSIDFLFDE